ncbi:hypothetical protein BDV39DRAFT_203195 [Aspergillus sergii]|uniref:FAD dependent oxidoreductase domain-containing protein n=1 Tax=Aspergillus sergii TaxID=1034303 RepID=A0A5N6X7P8_9EURO|nr:hypothetical protein BDV39DRAFT_203195 [Aspergillus sergii]
MIDTDVAMAFLMRLVQSKGAVLETREIIGDLRLHEQELLSDYHADIIVNASGIGARELATDTQIFPVRGAVKKIRRPEGYPADHAFLLPAQMNHDGSLNLSLDSPEVKAMWERATGFLPFLKDTDHESHLLHKACAPSLIRMSESPLIAERIHAGSFITMAMVGRDGLLWLAVRGLAYVWLRRFWTQASQQMQKHTGCKSLGKTYVHT